MTVLQEHVLWALCCCWDHSCGQNLAGFRPSWTQTLHSHIQTANTEKRGHRNRKLITSLSTSSLITLPSSHLTARSGPATLSCPLSSAIPQHPKPKPDHKSPPRNPPWDRLQPRLSPEPHKACKYLSNSTTFQKHKGAEEITIVPTAWLSNANVRSRHSCQEQAQNNLHLCHELPSLNL